MQNLKNKWESETEQTEWLREQPCEYKLTWGDRHELNRVISKLIMHKEKLTESKRYSTVEITGAKLK